MTPLERAVIEAARAYLATLDRYGTADDAELAAAVKALDAAPVSEVQEIGWHELAEGDQLRSAKTGLFWEVVGILKVRSGYKIGIRRDGNRADIGRPTPAEPTAFVKRGATGKAVETFVNVFSSGETR